MVSSNSSRIIRSTLLTPASPAAASENTTGLPMKTPAAPRASALKTSVPRRTPPSRNTGIWPRAALTTSSSALMVAGT
uniref:Uncharacterized protein n=1 Tax=Arundo donax TaxID=35708 RepID=A0A0A9DNW2_ARUDO